MNFKSKVTLFLLFLSIIVTSTTLAIRLPNPLRDCQQWCERKGQGFECHVRCHEEFPDQQQQRGGGGHGQGGQFEDEDCQMKCERLGDGQGFQCQRICQKEFQLRHPILANFFME